MSKKSTNSRLGNSLHAHAHTLHSRFHSVMRSILKYVIRMSSVLLSNRKRGSSLCQNCGQSNGNRALECKSCGYTVIPMAKKAKSPVYAKVTGSPYISSEN